jgi:hypothetical protein
MMLWPRRSVLCLAVLVIAAAAWAAHANEAFPFGSELMLDTPPMHGSKRVPMIEIEDDGTAVLDLWCASAKAQAIVGDATITIVPGVVLPPAQPCEPERQARDADLLTALAQVTGWRRHGDLVELSGPAALRFHLMTN